MCQSEIGSFGVYQDYCHIDCYYDDIENIHALELQEEKIINN